MERVWPAPWRFPAQLSLWFCMSDKVQNTKFKKQRLQGHLTGSVDGMGDPDLRVLSSKPHLGVEPT